MTTKIQATRLQDGKGIVLEKGERLATYKNIITGDILYSTNKYEKTEIQGKEFLPVFKKPTNPRQRRVNLISLDSLERIKV